MAVITGGSISGNGFGTGSANSDITVKDLDMTVSNYVKDQTPLTNMAMSKKKKINNVQHIWPHDYFRTPALNAKQEGAAVGALNGTGSLSPVDNTRSNLTNFTQIFSTVVGSTGSSRAIEQAGGDPQAYQEVKQLTEIMFDVELQMVRTDNNSTKFSGNASTQTNVAPFVAPVAPDIGRRFGSLSTFAGTVSSGATAGTVSAYQQCTTSDQSDILVNLNVRNAAYSATSRIPFGASNNLTLAGSTVWLPTPTGTSIVKTQDYFTPAIYKQLVTTAEARFNAKITNVVCATSRRTSISDNIPQSRGINRVNSAMGDSVTTYEGDFNYTYQISDNWIMDQTTAGGDPTVVFFLNPDVIQWGSLRELGPNNEVFSNADASLDQYIMEGTLIVRNPAGVALLRDIKANDTNTPTTLSNTTRNAADVNRYIS